VIRRRNIIFSWAIVVAATRPRFILGTPVR
jgi:hypothetical protein